MAGEWIQRRLLITGRVQGVGFRASTARRALRCPGLKGFVRNLPDGRVEAVLAGPSQAVLEMVEWCKHGPPGAKVLTMEIAEQDVDPTLEDFGVARGN